MKHGGLRDGHSRGDGGEERGMQVGFATGSTMGGKGAREPSPPIRKETQPNALEPTSPLSGPPRLRPFQSLHRRRRCRRLNA
jgi:hypothetical protein